MKRSRRWLTSQDEDQNFFAQVRHFLFFKRAYRKVLAEMKADPRWNEATFVPGGIDWTLAMVPVNEEDYPSIFCLDTGLRSWRDERSSLHRLSGPAAINVWGYPTWVYRGTLPSKPTQDLLDDVWFDRNLTDERALMFSARASSLDARHNTTNGLTPVQWVSAVIARHPSRNLSEDTRTMMALVAMTADMSS